MLRATLCCVLIFATVLRVEVVVAQTNPEVLFRAQQIKSDTRYLHGEGRGLTNREADDNALDDLLRQISVVVSSSFQNQITETTRSESGGQLVRDYEQKVESIIKTYSTSSLSNVDRLTLTDEPEAHVLRYMLRSRIDSIFTERQTKVFDFYKAAERFEAKGDLSKALRYYNWSHALLRSLPDADRIRGERIDGSAFLITAIPDRIRSILQNLSVAVVEVEDDVNHRKMTLGFTYNGKPVRAIDYSYFDGRSQSRLIAATDGRGAVDFFGELAHTRVFADLQIEYAYGDNFYGDKEVEEAYKMFGSLPYPLARKRIELAQDPLPFDQLMGIDDAPAQHVLFSLERVESEEFKTVVDLAVGLLKQDQEVDASTVFTGSGEEVFNKLLRYGKARLIDDSAMEVLQTREGYIVRGIYMDFDFPKSHKKFTEEVVFHLTNEKRISTVAFGLGTTASKDIYQHPLWTAEEKYMLVDFLEQYKTAYALKRLDYIESIFDDNALIIVGKVLKEVKSIDGRPVVSSFAKGNPKVQYNTYSKREYIDRLEHVFASKEFINIEFEESTLRKSNANPNLFGVQIAQNYRSSNYSDFGYLFLLIDFADKHQPTIHVRTWQPEKDKDGRVFGIEDF